jgi:hypothetical protein
MTSMLLTLSNGCCSVAMIDFHPQLISRIFLRRKNVMKKGKSFHPPFFKEGKGAPTLPYRSNH